MPIRQGLPTKRKKIKGTSLMKKRKSIFEKARLKMAQRRAIISLRGKAALSAARNRRTSLGRKRKKAPAWRTRY